MGWTDTDAGPVWVDDGNGRAQLRDADGQVVEVDPQDAGYWLGQGYSQAAPSDVQAADSQFQAYEEAAAQPWRAGVEGLAEGTIDLATGLPQLALGAGELAAGAVGATGAAAGLAEARAGITGRAALGAVGELVGGDTEAQYRAGSSQRAQANPWAAGIGAAIPEIAAGIATGGATAGRFALHVDHIKPRSLYPARALDPENLQVLCRDCNLGKSNKDATDWR
jgi:X-X-X-Leu-X-X-Gly heptad repeat protein